LALAALAYSSTLLHPSQIEPGSEGQILQTVNGYPKWVNSGGSGTMKSEHYILQEF